ncbi:hypothetical protein AB4486_22495 [Vibrio sp. 10N.222.55.C6]|uniref:hypothetical protein n=1 Tax=Vibrio sp. 10N.222.55.C6 TaxID=3229649 RepID=UPI00354B1197
MSNLSLIGINEEAIPKFGTPHRQLLEMYLTGECVEEDEIVKVFGRNVRTLIQALRGDRFNHWRFISIYDSDGVISARHLDPRHLSQDRQQDALARAERRKELKSSSHRQAMKGAARVERAFDELQAASNELTDLTLGNKKPVSKSPQAN